MTLFSRKSATSVLCAIPEPLGHPLFPLLRLITIGNAEASIRFTLEGSYPTTPRWD